MLAGNTSSDEGGGAYRGTLNNCTLVGNSVMDQNGQGGGAYNATLNNCELVGNTAVAAWNANGGGAAFGTLNNCKLIGNFSDNGGGAYAATLNNCTLSGNSAEYGGGACAATLNNCTLIANSATEDGGGILSGWLRNCMLMANSAKRGGGASGHYYHGSVTLTNCTLVANSGNQGGGANEAQLKNCILYYNTALFGENYFNSSMNYCCTSPSPSAGTGNITAEPALASFIRLSTHSPCRAAGSAAYASGVDLDGEPWASPPSIGCDEYWSGSVTGALNVAVVATHTNGVAGSPLDFQAVIHGRASASSWDFGDGVIVSNRPFASHTWSAPGDYLVTIIAYNDTYPSGVSATVAVHVASQPVHYVSLSNPLPLAPYTSWTTAATNIQDAVDAAAPGALVLVGNGVYQSGARTVYGMSNRVAVTKAITIRSVNGPLVTTISGYQLPGIANGPAAVRCVYLTNSAVLSGFTLTNGATQTSGNSDTNQSGGGIWCESSSALVTNCILTGNTASDKGGGIYFGTLNNSTLTGNSASDGGGAFYSVLNDCMLSSNSVASSGGGAYNSTLNNCALSGNSAGRGGGAYSGTLNNCTLTSNSAAEYGGGAHSSTLNNCMVMGNSASDSGGGIFSGTLNNCTLTLNRASFNAGGAYGGTLNNCIVYYNSTWLSEPNYDSSTLNFCCTFPMPKSGTGNITNEPVLASFSHLSEASPCRGVGSAAYVRGVDLDGELWANPPSIGCDEYWTGSVTGSLSAGIVASFTNVVVGVPVDFQALIEGRLSASRWDFGDGGVISNRPSVSHAWAAPGNYSVELRAYNQDHPAGVAATVMVHVVAQSVHYVASSSTNPVYPYTNWLTAATNIQDAVDAAPAWALVRVTNGVYQSGTRVIQGRSNRVAVTKPMTVSSVNGPVATAIVGSGLNNSLAVRCVYLASGAVIAGFTLTNGATQSSGGGAWCESTNAMLTNCVLSGNTASCGGGVYFGTLNNCTLTGNSAVGSFGKGGGAYYSAVINCDVTSNSADSGGGAYSCTLYNCTLTGNSAESEGGGAYNSTLNNCTLSSNSVDNFGGGASHSSLNNCVLTWNSATGWLGQGGGAYRSTLNNCTLTGNSAVDQGGGDCWSTLNNCIVYYNRTQRSGPNYSLSRLNYCCTYPMPSFGTGNITNEPVLASTSRLSSQSPCREAGSLVYAMGLDIDGEEWGSPPSMGCDEYRSGAVSGSLAVAISATYTNLAVGLPVDFQAIIGGRLSASRWDFGDGTVVSNQPYTSHSWLSPGVYVVELRGFNETHPIGVTTTVTMHVLNQPIHYVSLASTNPLPPYTSWATAATNIQAGVDAATVPGSLVLVGNGAYKAGERPSSLTTSRVIVDKPVVVRSVNGPSYTHILGENGDFSLALRCVYLTNRAVLSGFTLTRGWSWASDGGGVWCESASAVVTNCVITGNLADFYGGGAFSGTLYNCTLMGNVASDGGGAYSSTLNNCTLSDNSTAGFGGGVRYSTLNTVAVDAQHGS
ncbi:MAG: PKD domain-containing protein [Verrucomicrobia bacterium]|nr:PKD domain-containing protein [Verrucomicrobiota bacterium]